MLLQTMQRPTEVAAQRVSSKEVLRIVLSIGPTETMHFQTWHDKAGAAVSPPLAPLKGSTDKRWVFPTSPVPGSSSSPI
jgi:hypothetical protein